MMKDPVKELSDAQLASEIDRHTKLREVYRHSVNALLRERTRRKDARLAELEAELAAQSGDK